MTLAQMAGWQVHLGVWEGQEREPLATAKDKAALQGLWLSPRLTVSTRANAAARSHIETLPADLPGSSSTVSVIDGHPTTLCWLGSGAGNRANSLDVEHFGQTGAVQDLCRHSGIDRAGILTAVDGLTAGRPIPLKPVN